MSVFPDLSPVVELQTIYKDQARRGHDVFARVLDKRRRPPSIDEGLIDDFEEFAWAEDLPE